MRDLRLHFSSEGEHIWENALFWHMHQEKQTFSKQCTLFQAKIDKKHMKKREFGGGGVGKYCWSVITSFLQVYHLVILKSIRVTFFDSNCIYQDNSSYTTTHKLQTKGYLLLEDNYRSSTFNKIIKFFIINIQNMQI